MISDGANQACNDAANSVLENEIQRTPLYGMNLRRICTRPAKYHDANTLFVKKEQVFTRPRPRLAGILAKL